MVPQHRPLLVSKNPSQQPCFTHVWLYEGWVCTWLKDCVSVDHQSYQPCWVDWSVNSHGCIFMDEPLPNVGESKQHLCTTHWHRRQPGFNWRDLVLFHANYIQCDPKPQVVDFWDFEMSHLDLAIEVLYLESLQHLAQYSVSTFPFSGYMSMLLWLYSLIL